MSFLSKVFGSNRKSPKNKSTPSDAIKQLKQTEEMLYKKQNYLETKIEKEVEIARNNAKKNKKIALHALQRKKRYEQQLEQINGTINTIEVQRAVLEESTTNSAVVSSMKNASDALKANNKFMNPEQLDEMFASLADQREMTDEISNAISQPVQFIDDDIDEDELEKELRELELDDIEEKTPTKIKDKLPSVPQDELTGIPASKKDSIKRPGEKSKQLEAS